ncbi:hypothetical protein G7Y89_g10440 [Cudoniella acicularis]|uniref:Heterokaryon incompatibility domain-containing protein n=1 Tax=Cudoniella acicularis TaxID=354080 RepID=A0A8H4RDU5_9HELO|nr:hypothetical protein G7Y89_g10440 [Cudoniella acicularis]
MSFELKTGSNLCDECSKLSPKSGCVIRDAESLSINAELGCPCCTLICICAENFFAGLSEIEEAQIETFQEDGPGPNEVWISIRDLPLAQDKPLRFEVFRKQDDVGVAINDLVLLRQPYEHPFSTIAMERVKRWLQTCQESHFQCTKQLDFLPTRVIDLSGEEPVLIDGINAPHGHYITLSHCWGLKIMLTTTQETKTERYKGIPLSLLPKVFEDAIKIAKILGMIYLWIDSLCIIQDSVEDWQKESKRMHEYYGNSILTISALDSPDSHHGILNPRESEPFVTLTSEQNLLLRKGFPAQRDVFGFSPLNSRAWALQERLLSTRILHYGKHEIFWECMTCSAREGSTVVSDEPYQPGYVVISEGMDFKRIMGYLKRQSHLEAMLGPAAGSVSSGVESIWFRLVTRYTIRDLTKVSDRLPAISGLASQIAQVTKREYLAGIWKEDLEDLLWIIVPYLYKTPTRAKEIIEEYGYQAPSWSWASTPWASYYPRRGREHHLPNDSDLRIIDSKVSTIGHNPFGQVKDGHLKIQGYYLNVLQFHEGAKDDSVGISLQTESFDHPETFFWTASLDEIYNVEKPSPKGGNYVAIFVLEKVGSLENFDEATSPSHSYCLLLVLCEGQFINGEKVWKRVGTAETSRAPRHGGNWNWKNGTFVVI